MKQAPGQFVCLFIDIYKKKINSLINFLLRIYFIFYYLFIF